MPVLARAEHGPCPVCPASPQTVRECRRVVDDGPRRSDPEICASRAPPLSWTGRMWRMRRSRAMRRETWPWGSVGCVVVSSDIVRYHRSPSVLAQRESGVRRAPARRTASRTLSRPQLAPRAASVSLGVPAPQHRLRQTCQRRSSASPMHGDQKELRHRRGDRTGICSPTRLERTLSA